MIIILLKKSTDFSIERERVTELKKYLNNVVVRGRQNLFLFRLGRDL